MSKRTDASVKCLIHDPSVVKELYKSIGKWKSTVGEWIEENHSFTFSKSKINVRNYDPQSLNESENFDISPHQCIQNPFDIRIPPSQPTPHQEEEVITNKRKWKKRETRIPCNYDHIKKHVFKNCDIFAHAGGSVWGLALCPRAQYNADTKVTTHFLVVGTSSLGWCGEKTSAECDRAPYLREMGVGYDFPYEIGKVSQFPNVLQVYKIEVAYSCEIGQNRRSEKLHMDMALCYCVGLPECGPVFDIQWSLSDGWGSGSGVGNASTEDRNREEDNASLGIVAVLCGDGKCRVILLPTPVALGCENGQPASSANTSPPNDGQDIIDSIPLISILHLYRWELCMSEVDMVTAIAWGLSCQPHVLACGMASGKIVTWDLSEISPPVLSQSSQDSSPANLVGDKRPSLKCESSSPHIVLLDLSRYKGVKVVAERTAVRSLMFHPKGGNLLCSGGHDGLVKVWDLEERYRPIYARETSTVVVTVSWSADGEALMWSTALNAMVNVDVLWSKVPVVKVYSHLANHGAVWSIASYEFDTGKTLIISTCSDGSVLTASSKDTLVRKKSSENCAVRLFRVVEDRHFSSHSTEALPVRFRAQVPLESGTRESPARATVTVDCSLGLSIPDSPSRTHSPPVAMQRVTYCEGVMMLRHSFYSRCRLVAYGGASGLVRVHMIHQDIFGTDTTL